MPETKEERSARCKKYNLENYEKVKNKVLKYQYGITLDDYNQMFADQNGCCAICGFHQSEFKTALCVDHCHQTNKVRGLLCKECNLGLGKFKDNLEYLKNAVRYLTNKIK